MDNGLQDHWGKSVAIDLFGCDYAVVSNHEKIKEFISQVINEIDMVPHGPVYVDRFGEGELEGYSAMQFIKTSSITVHADEFGMKCFVDIFSCKDFDEKKAEEFSKNYFGAKETKATTLLR